jgi:hypothetical protein
MPSQFARGAHAIAECDRCGFRFKLKELRKEIVKTKLYQVKVCKACWNPDQPQLQLGMQPVNDPQALREPRPDTSYIVSGLDVDGDPSGGSRIFQWGFNPVGGARDGGLTPNDLIIQVQLGTVAVLTS